MSLVFRDARQSELRQLVQMLADDSLGAERETLEDPLPDVYEKAFEAIIRDPNNRILVADLDGQLAGFLQLTFIPGLTYTGRSRALVEGVRVNASLRGQGTGQALVSEAIRLAREAGCCMVQLSSNKQRTDALRFYESLGFVPSHEGMKLHLD